MIYNFKLLSADSLMKMIGVKRKLEGSDESTRSIKKSCDKCNANRASLKYAGPYVLGPIIATAPVKSITQCLGRKMATEKFYSLKLLTMQENVKQLAQDLRHGKMLIHTEYSLLSLLNDQEGVVHTHGLFQEDVVENPTSNKSGCRKNVIRPIKRYKRLCLVLDCLTPHDYSPHTQDLTNLQHYVIKEKKLSEREAFIIFLDIVRVVNDLHERNIVHRDLKLGNLVLNKKTKRITITNFCLGKHLVRSDDLLLDQRGSPAYISPDVLSGKPYCGKASDNWALGVVLYTMLYGQFPFYDTVPQELFRKIKTADFLIPKDRRVGDDTVLLIHQLLTLDPKKRATAKQTLNQLQTTVSNWYCSSLLQKDNQIVPDVDKQEDTSKPKKVQGECILSTIQSIPSLNSTKKENILHNRRHQFISPIIVNPVNHVVNPVNHYQLNRPPINFSPILRTNQRDARPLTPSEYELYARRRLATHCPPRVSPF